MSIKALVISNYRDTQSVRPEAESMIGMKKAGLDLTIMTFPDAPYVKEFKNSGIRVIPFHPEKRFNKAEVDFIKSKLIELEIDVLYLFNNDAIVNGMKAAMKLPVKVVLYRGYTGNIHWWDPISYTRFLNPRVDKIVCLAQSVYDIIAKQKVVSKKKLIVINKGHKPEWYQDIQPVENFEEFGIPRDAFTVICVANNRRMKGVPYLMEATKKIPVELPIHYLLVGNKMDAPPIQKVIDQSPNKDKIHFSGFRKDILNLVKRADVFVLPSIKGEAITKSVFEAMCLGVAPIITDIAGNKGLVIDKECGRVVPAKNPDKLAEAILDLYHNPELRKLYAENAPKHIFKNFHNDRTVRETLALFEDLTGKKVL
jgi:L-malate glycosyltransferase